MRKILSIVLLFVLTNCSKSIDIDFKLIKEENTMQTNEDYLVGVWEGIMECPVCCDKKNGYRFVIYKQKGNKLEGNVKVFSIPNKQFYVVFKLDITYNKDTETMVLKTGGTDYILEYNNKGRTRCGEYCINNTYELKLSDDKKFLNGEWTQSSNCRVSSVKSPINLEKLQ